MVSKNELKMVDNWDINYIDQLVKSGEEESIRLEYKSGKWLEKTDKGKCKLKKWVTSFANSSGGFLVIGVPEKKINGKGLPDDPDGVDKTTFDGDIKKWIEDVIANGIFPHLNPIPKIKIISMPSGTNKEIVVMWIPQTIAVAHKITYRGKDYYFHRHETQVLLMDEWEVRALLFGRTPPPVLDLEWGGSLNVLCQVKDSGNRRVIFHDKFVLRLMNNGFGIGKNIQIGIIFPPEINLYYPRYELMEHTESEPGWALKKVPIRTGTEDNIFSEIIPPQFKQFFKLEGQYFVIKINDPEVIHSADSKNYFFNLKITERSTEIRSNLGAYILSENSVPRFFGIEIVINNFNEHRQTADLNVNVQKYTEDKIPIVFSTS